MTAPAVVIEMPAEERAGPQVTAMLDACTRGAGGPCVLSEDATDAAESSASSALAIVTWSGEELRVARVEVGFRRASRAEWRARTVEFRVQDAPAERWRSVGLVIATLLDETVRAAAAAPKPPEPPPLPPPSPPLATPAEHPPAPPPSTERVTLDAGGLIGPGLDSGGVRLGGWLRGEYVLGVPLALVGGLRYAVRPADAQGVTFAWGSGSVGVAGVLRWRAVRVQARLEALVEVSRASVSAGASDSGSRWLSGGRVGVDGVWMLAPVVGVVVGFDESVLGGGTTVTVRGQPVGRSQPMESTALLGVRLAL